MTRRWVRLRAGSAAAGKGRARRTRQTSPPLRFAPAGVPAAPRARRWNPKMEPYLFGVRNGIHIIDLEQTVPMLHRGLQQLRDTVAGGGRVLFVGTKRQAQEPVAEAAKRCGQYYVNHRWLGGMLANFKTISHSIRRLRELDER